MYCPQCGQQQVSDVIRYCSRCGFLLDGVTAVVARGGTLPTQYVQPAHKQLSPRDKGVRQGALMMLSTLLLVPLGLAIFAVAILEFSGVIVVHSDHLVPGGGCALSTALLLRNREAG